ncbi:MAG: hypothetical protein ABI467_10750 [Kofleriaceae bacterium]
MRVLAIVVAALAAVSCPRPAAAYPQYQLSSDKTCTSCHLAPDGGGILTENGVNTAEATAWHPGDGNFMYGMAKPSWLELGGDVRGAAGYVNSGVSAAAGYPMQAEVAASAHWNGFSLHATGGLRRPQEDGSALHALWSREHYLMWQSRPDDHEGLYVRVGRLMPTFGLRLAEHVVYTQRYGGEPLYGEVYALAASYVTEAFEVHASGFVHDPIASAQEHGDGGALYAELRLGDHAAIGAEAKYAASDDAHRTYGGMTGKLYLPGPAVLVLAEAEVIHESFVPGGDRVTQLAGYALASHPLGGGFLLDLGAGHFTEDTRVQGLFRDCLDANLHWFQTSHVEWLLTTRLELLDLGSHQSGGYVLAQIHYRL